MALKYSITTNTGTPVTYWKIGEIHHLYDRCQIGENVVDGKTQIILYGYINEDIRRANMRPVETIIFEYPLEPLILIPDHRAYWYGKIMEITDPTGAWNWEDAEILD